MASDFHVHEPLTHAGGWHQLTPGPSSPLSWSWAAARAALSPQLACAHPENNYLGIDITDKVLILAKRKIEAAYAAAGRPVDNVKIMSTDIRRIRGVIAPEDTVQRIYINFRNPGAKRLLQQAPAHLPPAADPVPGLFGPTAARSTSRPTTTICSGQPGVLPRIRVRDPLDHLRPAQGRACPEHPHRTRGGCLPRWASPSRH